MNIFAEGLKSAKKDQIYNSRIGDWICFNCSNLNYSFRNTCNRCQNITKAQNQVLKQMLLDGLNQNLQLYNNGFQSYLFIDNIQLENDNQNQCDEQPDDENEKIYKLLVQDEEPKENKEQQMKKIQALNQRMMCSNNLSTLQKENNQKLNLLMTEILHSKKDWICSNCRNLNYSFRFKCNRCKHEMSD